MDDALEERIRRAVAAGAQARSEYFVAIGLPDEQVFGPPASEARVAELEHRLGKTLPPSYRTFLLLFNGWRSIDGGVDLLAVDEMLSGPRAAKVANWQKRMLEAGDAVAARSLVIGLSSITATRYLLDPQRVDEAGEWRFVQHHAVEEAELPSFLQWLEESIDEYHQLACMERQGTSDEETE